MAKRFRLKEAEAALGYPLEELIPGLVNTGGQKHAASVLGVSQASISKWLKTRGYEQRIIWERPIVTEEEKAS